MPAAIPVYRRQATIAGAGIPEVQRMQAVPQSDASAQALAGVARAASQVGAAIDQRQQADQQANQQRQQGIEAVAMADVMARAHNDFGDELQKSLQGWKMGDDDLRPGIQKRLDEWADEVATKFTSPAVRQHFQVQAINLRQKLLDKASMGQDATTMATSAAQFTNALDQAEERVYRDPQEMPWATVELGETLKLAHIAEDKKILLAPKIRERLSMAAERSELDKDPAGFYAKRWGTYSLGYATTGAPSTPGAVDAGRVFASMIQSESAGQQFGKDGQPLTSKAGAVGIAQVMPSTGPEAARLAGVEWDEKRFRSDANYNARLGQAYFNDQLRKFGGDFTKAVAAYNAGPARVEALASKYGDNWLQHAPDETQGYVRSVSDRLGLAGNGRGFAVPADGGATATTAPAMTVLAPPDKGPASFEALPYEKREQLRAAAEGAIRKNETVFRSQFEVQVKNATAMHADGLLDPGLPRDAFLRAYGPDQGDLQWRNYQAGRDMAGAITQFKTQSVDEITAALNRARPTAQSADYAAADARFGVLQRAAAEVVKQREADPIAFAIANKMAPGVQTIDLTRPETLAAQLPLRAALSATMRDRYGVQNPNLLQPHEAAQAAAILQQAPTPQKLQLLDQIRAGSAGNMQAFRRVIQQVAPDSPVTTVAAAILGQERGPTVGGGLFSAGTLVQPRAAAQVMLEGEQLLNPSKGTKAEDGKGARWPMPKDTDLAKEFTDEVGNVFANDARGYETAYQAFRAYYAGKAARQGLLDASKVDSDIAQEAVAAATGGVSEFNGQKVLRPWGTSEKAFKSQLRSAFDAAIAANGLKGSPYDNFDAYRFIQQGPGVYVPTSGAGAGGYLPGAKGQPLALQIDAGRQVAAIPGVMR